MNISANETVEIGGIRKVEKWSALLSENIYIDVEGPGGTNQKGGWHPS